MGTTTKGEELPVLTPSYLASADGWSLRPNRAVQQELIVKDIGLFSNANPTKTFSRKYQRPSSPILVSSDSEYLEEESDNEENEGVELGSNTNVGNKRKSLEEEAEFPVPSSKKRNTDHVSAGVQMKEANRGVVGEREWFAGLHCSVCIVRVLRTGPVYVR